MNRCLFSLLILGFLLSQPAWSQNDDPIVEEHRRALSELGGRRRLNSDPGFLKSKATWPQMSRVVLDGIKDQDLALVGTSDVIEKSKILYGSRVQQGRAVDHYLYGRLLGLTNDLEGAYAQFKKSLQADRFFFWAWDGLGVYHTNRRQWTLASQNFRTALRINDQFEKAGFGLSQCLIQKGDIDGAKLELLNLIGRDGMDRDGIRQARLLLAEVYRSQNDHVRALDELSSLERDGFRDFRIHAMKAFCNKSLERWSDAANEYEKLLTLRPDEHRFHMALADCYIRLGRNADAIARIEKSLAEGGSTYSAAERREIDHQLDRLRRRPAKEDPKAQRRGLDEWITQLLHSSEVKKRREAVIFLSKAPTMINRAVAGKIKNAFARALKDSDYIVVAKSLQQLSMRYGGADLVRDLVKIFLASRYDRRVRGMAANLLRNWEDRNVVPDLILAIQDEQDPYVFSQLHDSLNTLTLAWIERVLPLDFESEVVARNRVRWVEWYRANRDMYRKFESKAFKERWK